MPNVLAYTMSLDNKGFTGPLQQAGSMVGSSLGKISGSLIGLGAGIAGGLASFEALKGIASAIKNVAETGRTLQLLHGATGQSVHDLVILRKAFEEVGVGAEAVPQVLTMMQAALGGVNEQGQPTKHIFDQLGISIDSLKGRPAIEQLNSIAAAIGQLSSQEEKMAAARAIFGRFGGRDMLAILGDPNLLKRISQEYGGIATVQEKNAAAFAKLAVAAERLKAHLANVFVGLTEQIGPQLTALLDRIKSSFDGLKIGERLGDSIRVALAGAQTGQIGQLIGLSIMAGIEKVAPTIQSALMNAFRTPLAYFQAKLQQLFYSLSHPGGMSGEDFSKSFMRNPLGTLGKMFGGMTLGGDQGAMASEAADLQKRMADILAQPAEAIGPASTKFQDELQKLVESIQKSAGYIAGAPKPDETTAGAGGTNKFSLSDVAQQAASGAKINEGDRLARIGGFIGGGASGMLDYARRTAGASEKSAAALEQIKQKLGQGTQQPAATYA